MNIYNSLKTISINDHYFHRYLKIIQYYSSVKINSSISEKHHILPSSLFPEHKNNPENIIILPLKAHYIVHLLLHKFIGGKMTQAFKLMCKRPDINKNSVFYENSRIYHNELMKTNFNPNFGGKSIKKYWESCGQERREKQSNLMKKLNLNRWNDSRNKEKLIKQNKERNLRKGIIYKITSWDRIEFALSLTDVSLITGVSKSTIYNYIKSGKLYKGFLFEIVGIDSVAKFNQENSG